VKLQKIIEGKSSAEVGATFEEFRGRFASVEPKEIELKIKVLEACRMSDGSAVTDNSDVNKWATSLETNAQSIRTMLSTERAEAEGRIQLPNLARVVMLHAPFNYKLYLKDKLDKKRSREAMFNVPAGGWTPEALVEYNKTIVLDWTECKKHLNHYYRQKLAGDKDPDKRKTPTMATRTDGVKRTCASCNSGEHLVSDCPKLNASLPFAPDDVKAKLQAKLKKQAEKRKQRPQPYAPRKRQWWQCKGSEGKGKGKGGDWNPGRWDGGKGQGQGKGALHGGMVSKPCFRFRDTGSCGWGANCKF
jgi:hypothetical protein